MAEPGSRSSGAPCALALLACLLLAAPAALAERWYQVELIIFAQPGGGAGAERWDPLPALEYPGASRFLVDPQRIGAALAARPGDARLDPFGRLLIAPPAPFGEAPGDAAAYAQPAGTGPDLPTPFLVLPAGDQAFRGKAAYMERTGGYRILFHETWLQPMAGQQDALPIVIDTSGDSGEWPALQGSVQFYVSRYLHLDTNLWLNTDGGYLPGRWRMPAPPLGPPSIIVEEPADGLPETGSRGTVPGPADDGGAANDPGTVAISPVAPDGKGDPGLPGTDAAAPATAAPLSPWRHAVLLSQKRRMRSNEVHYIDHPMLGVIVQLTPLDEEELLLRAEQERARAPLPPELSANRLAAD